MPTQSGIASVRSVLQQMWEVMRHELYIIMHERVFLALLFIIPTLLFPLFIMIYNTGMITDLPIAVYDADNSQMSRSLTRAMDASSSMQVVHSAHSMNELKNLVRKGTVYGALYFPPEMGNDLKRGKQVFPVIFKNAQNLQTGNLIYKDALAILRTWNAGILLKKVRAAGLSQQQSMALVNPIATDVSILYNPNFSYTTFLCPGVIFAQFQVIIMLTALLLVNLEFRTRHRRDYPAPKSTVLKPWAILLSAAIPYLIILYCIAAAVIFILFPAFSMPVHGSTGALFVMTMLFITASFVPGMLAGLLFRKAVSGVAFAIVFNMPAFIFSGFTFPLWAMPQPLAVLANILPFTHYTSAFFKIGMIGMPLVYCIHEILILFLFIILPVTPAVWLFAAKRRHFINNTHKPLHIRIPS